MRSARLLKRDLKVNLYKMKNVKTKKSYEGKIKTNFHDNKMPKEASQYICQLVILIDFILKCFQETVNMLLKKKRSLNILLKVQKFLLMRKILIIHTNLMKDNFPFIKLRKFGLCKIFFYFGLHGMVYQKFSQRQLRYSCNSRKIFATPEIFFF